MVANIAVFQFSHTCFYRYTLWESSSLLYITAHTLLFFFFLLKIPKQLAWLITGKRLDLFKVQSGAAGAHGKNVMAQSASRCLLKKGKRKKKGGMLSEGKVSACRVWGRKLLLQPHRQHTSEDTACPEFSFVSLNEKISQSCRAQKLMCFMSQQQHNQTYITHVYKK